MKRLLALLLVASSAALVTAMVAGAQQSYTDPVGDAGPGTDIASVTVRNDQAGLISIQVASASPIVGNHAVAVFIDADKNQATGDEGDEAWMYGGPFVGAEFFTCTSAGCSPSSGAGFSAGAVGPNVTEFRFNRAAIGNVSSFNFAVVSISIDPPNINFWDAAPGAGYFTYDLVVPQCSNGRDDDGDGTVDSQDLGCSSATDENEADEAVTVRLGSARVTPAVRRAGSVVTITASTTRVENGNPLDGGTVRCTATYAPRKTLRGSGSVVGGNATCRLRVPLAARGKTVRGVMTITYKTAKATARFSFRVR